MGGRSRGSPSARTRSRPEADPSGPDFLAITGPTTSGKTELSLQVAEALGGEIVSMDSRQLYRGMDIGTDTVAAEARARVPHHGLDLVDPGERYSAGRFARDVRRWIPEIRARGRVPILAGGTGFFLRAVLEPIFAEPEMDPSRRRRLKAWLEGRPREELERWVRRLDPERAELAVKGGPQRVGRTLEVALLSGRPISWWHREAPADGPPLDGVVVVLELPREELDRRIDARVLRMVERGLVEEVRRLSEEGYGPGDPGMTGTGYREVLAHLRGECTLDEAVEEIQANTRRYARRQLTWFRNQLPEDAVRIDARLPAGDRLRRTLAAWEARP